MTKFRRVKRGRPDGGEFTLKPHFDSDIHLVENPTSPEWAALAELYSVPVRSPDDDLSLLDSFAAGALREPRNYAAEPDGEGKVSRLEGERSFWEDVKALALRELLSLVNAPQQGPEVSGLFCFSSASAAVRNIRAQPSWRGCNEKARLECRQSAP